MAEHRITKNKIIYIIPDDELFIKLNNDEAFIDEYGRLMNRKPHRVLKELKHYVEDTPMVDQRTSPPLSLKDELKDMAKDKIYQTTVAVVDLFYYEVLPIVWHEQIVPFLHRTKEILTTKELKGEAVIAKLKASTYVAERQTKTGVKMTQAEADAEKQKVLYHWLGLLSSLKKLHDAGEVDDIEETLIQLTEPTMLERVNGSLSENPNLLETDKYILLHSLLGRDLYEDKHLIPIEATEIKNIAES